MKVDIITQIEKFNESINHRDHAYDQLVQIYIFKYFKPLTVCELGAGAGNWPIYINEFIDYNIHFTLVDDFREVSTYNLDWPTNKKELTARCINLKDYEVVDEDVEKFIQISKKYDCIRIDYVPLNHIDLKVWIKESLTYNGIVFADDISPNRCVDRFLMMQELVAEGYLKLIWAGEDAACWANSDIDIDNIYNFLEKNTKNSIPYIEKTPSYTFFGDKYSHIITRPKKVYQNWKKQT